MLKRNQLAWKLMVVVLAIVAAVILFTSWFGNRLSRQYALNAVRNVMQFNSTSIASGIEELMLSEDHAEAFSFIEKMSRRTTTYEDVSLLSHPSGNIRISRLQKQGTHFNQSDRTCTPCHVANKPPVCNLDSQGEVITSSGGNRVLQVITPLTNNPSCKEAACHAHAESGTVLGLLRTDYSLAGFDNLMTGLKLFLVLVAGIAILFTIGSSLMLFRWLLAKPLYRLAGGIAALAAGDLDFRFAAKRNDEIGMAKKSFNNMATQIQNQQREIRRALEYLEAIVENTADLVITVSTDGLIQTFNRGAENTLGYSREEVIGKRIEMLFADPRERAAALEKLQGKDNVMNWRTHFLTNDGRIRHILLTLSRLKDRRGNVIGTLGISKDITSEIVLQEKLFRAEQEAAVGRAVTAIQHAIKNMLNTLKGGLYIVRVGRKNKQDERIVEGCDMIEEGLTRITDLSHSMLKYAREWKIEPEPVDLAEMAEGIITAVSQTAKERGITVTAEATGNLPKVLCDPRLFHMGLMDIVSNALDACELKDYDGNEKPEIVIRIYRTADGRSAGVDIHDNGCGMTPEVKQNVFTPFFSTKKKWGTGLGLALTSRIINLHDGEISVESAPDKGTIFKITLPLEGPRKKLGEE